MQTPQEIPLEVYTETTPNPESLKFVLNKMLLPNRSIDFRDKSQAANSPLATALFELPFVEGIFIANNYITITKQAAHEWIEISPQLRHLIKKYILGGKQALDPSAPASPNATDIGATDIESKIIQLLDTYVKPAVENDGGAIRFKSYKDGIVTLILQGACSGCPSSSITLKAGIEGLLQRMVPEVKEVIAEEG